MRPRLGVWLRHPGASELAWRVLRQAAAVDLTVFADDPAPPCLTAPAAVMRPAEAWGYAGPVVATHPAAARRLAACPGPAARLFYLWDLDWLRERPLDFAAARAVYADPRLTLVARTPEQGRLLRDLWGVAPAAVVPAADLPALLAVAAGAARA